MANHKSAKKRARQTITRTARNKARVTEVRSALKALRSAISDKDKEKALSLVPKAQGLLCKLAQDKIIKRNTAARQTSRLTSQAVKL